MNTGRLPCGSESAPYVGQRPYTENDRDIFFGRDSEAEELADLWQHNRLTIMIGASGSGKTSLLWAGVAPLLRDGSVRFLPIGRISHGSSWFPMAALPEQDPNTLALLASWLPNESPTRMSDMSVTEFLRRREMAGRRPQHAPFLVAIDQVERLYRGHDPRSRLRLVEELREAMDELPRTHLLLSVRDEHLDDVLEIAKGLDGGLPPLFPLRPLGRRRALEAVAGPMLAVGRRFDADAAERLVDDLQIFPPNRRGHLRAAGGAGSATEPTVEPAILQIVCRRLWEELPRDTGAVSTRLLPDVERVLADFCHQTLAGVAADHGTTGAELLAWLKQNLLDTYGEAPAGRDRVVLADSVLHALEDQHLVKRQPGHPQRFALQHRRLAEPLWRLGEARWPARRSGPAALLRAAEIALATGETHLAERHAQDALRAYGEQDLRPRAEVTSFLGNVALQQGRLQLAAERYDAAASMFAALGQTENVGWLLAAVGMLKLSMGERGAAVEKLSAASSRTPGDLRIQTELAQALWHTGQKQAALAVLSGVLKRDGGTPEALRTRGEFLADMGEAESAMRDIERVGSHLRPSTLAARALALARLSQHDAARREQAEHARAELDKVLKKEADSGPVLFRAAQVRLIHGDAGAATELASRAVDATDPPLPLHQEIEAQRLMEEARRLQRRL